MIIYLQLTFYAVLIILTIISLVRQTNNSTKDDVKGRFERLELRLESKIDKMDKKIDSLDSKIEDRFELLRKI